MSCPQFVESRGGPPGGSRHVSWWRARLKLPWCDPRVSESQHNAVEVNPPDYRLDDSGMPLRREEIDARCGALPESLRESHFSPAGTQVDQRKAQQPPLPCFKDDWRPAGLARIAPQLRQASLCGPPAGFVGEHGGWAYRRHRASGRSVGSRELSRRAIFALSTGIPTFGGAMLDPLPAIPGPCAARRAAEGPGSAGGRFQRTYGDPRHLW